MDIKLVSKNNMGVVATLILVILLSQSRVFDFLIDTAFGRAVLILFILGISYTNQILGVVAVLLIIIVFNQSNIGYIEGFTSSPTTGTTNKKLKLNEQQSATATASSAAATVPKVETFVAREGFNMIDRERTMQKGKRSSEVPVLSSSRSQNDNVEPTDKSGFTSSYSSV